MSGGRQIYFESLILQGIWLLILLAFKGNPKPQSYIWRANAIEYLDQFGNQLPEAKEFRRNISFPELH